MKSINSKSEKYKLVLAVLLALLPALASVLVARAEREEWADAPTTQIVGPYKFEYLTFVPTNYDAGTDVTFRFKVSDAKTGAPADGLKINLLGQRDYSGQVHKEHNGPKDPNVGPLALQLTGKPGEYSTVGNFWHNGHWRIFLQGESLGSDRVRFTQSIGADPTEDAGIRLDWLVWPVMLVLIIGIVFVMRRNRGETFTVPEAELNGYNEPVTPREPVAAGGR